MDLRDKVLSFKVVREKSFVKPETLHHTSSASKLAVIEPITKSWNDYRSKIILWQLTRAVWTSIRSKYISKTTDKLPAPETLLKFIHCKCTLDLQLYDDFVAKMFYSVAACGALVRTKNVQIQVHVII